MKKPVPIPEPHPPEELRALCGLCDVKIRYVQGRPGNAWELSVVVPARPATHVSGGRGRSRAARILQTVEYDVWNEAAKWLMAQRDAR